MADLFQFKAPRVSASVTLIAAAVLLLDQVTVTAKPLCNPGFYFDEVTGNCDHCSDICDQAETMNTVEECERKCPGYRTVDSHKKNKCLPQQYYDESVDRCDSCDTLCLHAEIRGKELDCRNMCPAWSEIKKKSIIGSQNNSDAHEDLAGKNVTQFPLWYVGGTTIPLVVIILVVSVPVTGLAMGVIIWYTRRRNKFQIKQERTECCNQRPRQAEQIESYELEPLTTAGGEVLTHPREEG